MDNLEKNQVYGGELNGVGSPPPLTVAGIIPEGAKIPQGEIHCKVIEPPRSPLPLIYEYGLKCMDWDKVALQSLNQRLIAIMIFVMLTLSQVDAIAPYLRYGILLTGSLSATFCVLGLWAKATGSLASPEQLMRDWIDVDENDCKIFISNSLGEACAATNKLKFRKARLLNLAMYAFIAEFILTIVALIP